jgi:alpha-galactosidase
MNRVKTLEITTSHRGNESGRIGLVIELSDEALELRIEVAEDGMARLTRLAPHTAPTSPAALPLVDVVLTGEGKAWSGNRYCESEAGGRLRYSSHDHSTSHDHGGDELRVDLADPVTGLRAEVFYRVVPGVGAVRGWTRLVNEGAKPLLVESVTSLLIGALPCPDDLTVHWADNDWLAEGRWQHAPLRDFLPDMNRKVHAADPRGAFGRTGTGTWSSGTHLPMAVLTTIPAAPGAPTTPAWAFSIIHNGGWHSQAGECTYRVVPDKPGLGGRHQPPGAPTGTYLALLGPTEAEHQWHITLAPGDSFTTLPVTVVVSTDGFDGAIAALTHARRAFRRPHADHETLPVIFNDYMNTINGDPTTAKLLPLIDAAAEAGAEYFVIDAGWYAEVHDEWWDTVGEWRPSRTRFPGGIEEVLDHIRDRGMVPGLWLEPEVVGVRSPVASQLPDEAFFQRNGRRIAEHGRYQLDLRHPAAVKHLNEVVDFVVGDLGVGYLKLDYNIFIAPGTDTGGTSPGAGLLAANRALLDWLDGVLDRHPGLVLENCSSGGMRTDDAMLSRMQLQSTSDQQDFLRYPPVAAAAPAAITPEQAANWAYPQPHFTDDEIAFTMCTGMLGRLYLSGHLDTMTPAQRSLVADAVRLFKEMRSDVAVSVPFWPLGLPRWTDEWIAVGLRAPSASYVTVWRRPGTGSPDTAALPLPHLRGQAVHPRVRYPAASSAKVFWDPEVGTLSISLPEAPAACLIQI